MAGSSSVRPHAVTAAGMDSYSYNANGDMTTRTVGGTTSTLAWDAMRRLSSSTKNGQTTSFIYDAMGQRLLIPECKYGEAYKHYCQEL